MCPICGFRAMICSSPGSRVIENKHSTDIGARDTFIVNAHTDARRRRRRFNVGRVLVLNNPPARVAKLLEVHRAVRAYNRPLFGST